ncbi:MAG: 4Fe-4S binding protein [Candidatus Gracilibacteria bacterium]|nr:4Fe-4S binding protein [Candidatus Gracilibacteria bacterium]
MPIGAVIPTAGNSVKTLTGKWTPKKIVHIQDKCVKCNKCVPVCPEACILKDKEGKMCGVDVEHCKKCGICVSECPFDALKLEDME